MAGVLFTGQRESDIWKNVGNTEIIMTVYATMKLP